MRPNRIGRRALLVLLVVACATLFLADAGLSPGAPGGTSSTLATATGGTASGSVGKGGVKRVDTGGTALMWPASRSANPV